ncbi:hypothetical protein P692DRAFT_20822745 [Suillus brevipes Sb2]|nr:hypothetical protein P692DRAFT_20822745 [Suillus brevipes Sb2]
MERMAKVYAVKKMARVFAVKKMKVFVVERMAKDFAVERTWKLIVAAKMGNTFAVEIMAMVFVVMKTGKIFAGEKWRRVSLSLSSLRGPFEESSKFLVPNAAAIAFTHKNMHVVASILAPGLYLYGRCWLHL